MWQPAMGTERQQTDGPVDARRLCFDRSGDYPLRAFLYSAGIIKIIINLIVQQMQLISTVCFERNGRNKTKLNLAASSPT